MREKCSYSEFCWSVFSHIRNEYWDLLCKSLHSPQTRENTDQKNSEYGHVLRSVKLCKLQNFKHWSHILTKFAGASITSLNCCNFTTRRSHFLFKGWQSKNVYWNHSGKELNSCIQSIRLLFAWSWLCCWFHTQINSIHYRCHENR